eukprot:TRINITY_DN8521_c0_g1_i1.p1 TRINITY_DN8521_c0_g1~~TRINITY_DN8521_c0_g1_i1.p1  ORF type:complete len:789 (+),score=293.33 TRINITY_DN8521_c0_g1_i1:94-2367(+)
MPGHQRLSRALFARILRRAALQARGRLAASDARWLAAAATAGGVALGAYGGAAPAHAEVRSEEDEYPTFSLDDVRKHNSAGSLWVTYQGGVYDVTEFLSIHPGGKEPLLGAGGQALESFWAKYQIHLKSPKALEWLEKYRIGSLSPEDTQRALDPQDPENAAFRRRNTAFEPEVPSRAVARARARGRWRSARVWFIALTAPLWLTLRLLVRMVGFFCPPLARVAARLLPISVPGYGGAEMLEPTAPDGTKRRIAIVGGGISGVGAAYSLKNSGYDVVLYEGRDKLGGNAQTHTFTPGGDEVRQDLSVLFWAPELYKNYVAFMKALGVEPAEISATYALHTNKYGHSEWFTPPGTPAEKVLQPSLRERFPLDFARFDKMCDWVRKVNLFFCGDPEPSFYKNAVPFNALNPLNYILLSQLCPWFGISKEWYNDFLVPFHGWNFSSIHIDNLPATAIETLDDIVPLSKTRKHGTWGPGNSVEVFEKATRGIDVRLSTRVWSADFSKDRVELTDDSGKKEQFDRVVFAAPAGMVCNVLGGNWMERSLLEGVVYHDDYERADWKDWLENPVHTDTNVVPGTPEQKEALMKHLSFIVDIDQEHKNAEYSHILGSWSPSAVQKGRHGAPMFVTQCEHWHRPVDPAKIESRMSPPRAHPDLCVQNVIITQLLKLIQGNRGAYFCSNWTTAGNCHDLSFLAGVSVAGAIGADYPFPGEAAARRDYDRLRSFMGLDAKPAPDAAKSEARTHAEVIPAAATLHQCKTA